MRIGEMNSKKSKIVKRLRITLYPIQLTPYPIIIVILCNNKRKCHILQQDSLSAKHNFAQNVMNKFMIAVTMKNPAETLST